MPIWPFSRGDTPLETKLWAPRDGQIIVSARSRAAIAKLREGFTEPDWHRVVALAIALGDRTREIAHKKPVREISAAFWLLGLYAADQATRDAPQGPTPL